MFNLTIAANTADELVLKMLDLVAHFNGINVRSTQPQQEIKPVISMAQMEENVAKAPVHSVPKPPPIEDVRAALKDLRERKGADAVREVLKAYGAENLTELKEEDYAGAMSRATAEV